MSYQTEAGYSAPKKALTLSKQGTKTELGKYDKKPEHPNKTAGLIIGGAIKAVFGATPVTDIAALSPERLADALKIVDALVDYQVVNTKKVEERL